MTKVRYECPECGLVEKETYKKEPRKDIAHVCWLCNTRGNYIIMTKTEQVEEQEI